MGKTAVKKTTKVVRKHKAKPAPKALTKTNDQARFSISLARPEADQIERIMQETAKSKATIVRDLIKAQLQQMRKQQAISAMQRSVDETRATVERSLQMIDPIRLALGDNNQVQ